MTHFLHSTDLRGLWLLDANRDVNRLIFDVTNQPFLPFSFLRNSDRIEKLIHNFLHHFDSTSYRWVHFRNTVVPDNDPGLVTRFFQIVKEIRDQVARHMDYGGDIILSKQVLPMVTDEILPPEALEKRRFLLYIVRAIITGNLTVEKASQIYKIPQNNIRIWISTFLTHGPLCFLRKPRVLHPDTEAAIAKFHFMEKSSFTRTCVRYAFLNPSRLRRMLRRNPYRA